MALQYRIYANNGAGGPVDLDTPVDTVSGLTWTAPAALAANSDTTYQVRAYDTVSGLEEQNVDARVRILLDGSQVDVTARPNPPSGLTAHPTAGGGARVEWSYNPAGQRAAPTGFHVYLGTPTISYSSPAATKGYSRSRQHYWADLTGLTDGAVYQVGVRSYNAAGDETNVAVLSITADATPPLNVTDLMGSLS